MSAYKDIVRSHFLYASLWFLLLTLLLTYPAIFQLGTHLLGGSVPDSWMFPWNSYIFREQLLQGSDPYYTDHIFYPVGTTLALHTYTEWNGMLSLFLAPFLNEIAIHNVLALLATFLSGFGTYLLVRHITGNTIAALFAGTAFAFCPFRMVRMSFHMNMALTQGLPFFFWTFLKLAETKKLIYSLLLAVFFAITTYCNYYFSSYLVLACAALFLFGLIIFPEWRNWIFVRNLLIAGVAIFVLIFPVLRNFYKARQQQNAISLEVRLGVLKATAASPGEYVGISPVNPHIRKRIKDQKRLIGTSNSPGIVTFVLGIAGIVVATWKKERTMLLFSCLAFFFFLLSLGPILEIWNQKIYLPYYLMRHVPLINHARIPSRYSIMVTLCLSITAAGFLSYLTRRIRREVVSFALLAFLVAELFSAPYPMTAFDPPRVFRSLGLTKGETMLTLPFYVSDWEASRYLIYQTLHNKRVLDGRIARAGRIKQNFDYFVNIPIAKSLDQLTNNPSKEIDSRRLSLERESSSLFRRFFGIEFLTLYPPFSADVNVLNYAQTIFPDLQLLAQEKEIKVYRLPKQLPQALRISGNEPGMKFFLLENWDVHGAKAVCIRSQSKLLIPTQLPQDPVPVTLWIRSVAGKRLEILMGDRFVITYLFDSPRYKKINLNLPRSELRKAHGILDLKIQGLQAGESPKLELKAVEITM